MVLFSILFRAQLVLSMSEDCSNEWNKVFASPTDPTIPNDYRLMYQYSGFTLNHLGNYDSCNDIDIARYAVAKFDEVPRLVQTYCGPIVCTKQDYFDMISQSGMIPYEIVFMHPYQNKHYREYDSGAIFMIVLCSVLGFFAVLATALDYALEEEQKSENLYKYLLCFSLTANMKRLLISKALAKVGTKDTFEVLEGIRTLSFFWIIFGHVNVVFLYIGVLSNYSTLSEEYKKWFYMLEYGFIYAVDSFFWISGFLMAYFLIIEIEKAKTYSIGKLGMLYLHRFLRLTPVNAFVIFFFLYLQEYLGRGPNFYNIKGLLKDCEDYWYSSLLYLNNFIPDYNGNYCTPVTWYLANEMQFSIAGPIVVIIYVLTTRLSGWLVVAGLCILNIATGGILAHHFDTSIGILFQKGDVIKDYYYYLYIKPYTRVAPYALGVASAFVVYSYRKFKETNVVYDKFALWVAQIQESLYVRMGLLVVGLGCINSILLVKFHAMRHPGDDDRYRSTVGAQAATFYSFERFTFGLGLTFIFLPLLLGHFSFIFEILTGNIWNFLSRLSYVMFMIHYSIIEVIVSSQKDAIAFDIYNHISWAASILPIVIVCSIPIVLLVELPALNIEKLVFAPASPPKVEMANKEERRLIEKN